MKHRKINILVAVLYASLCFGTAFCVGHNYDDPMPADFLKKDRMSQEQSGKASRRWPLSFRGTKNNEITGSQFLKPISERMNSGEGMVRVLQIGDSHVKGNYFPRALEQVLMSHYGGAVLEGVDMDCAPALDDAGMTFNYIGINGARTVRFTEPDMLERIANLNPDLVIVSFGTNEAHGNFNKNEHFYTLDALISGIRRNSPNAVFLLTTPPGSYITTSGQSWRDRRGRWHSSAVHVPNKRTAEVAEAIVEYGQKHNIAVWDVYSIAGGETFACPNWRNSGLMQTDQIHFTVQGYELQGSMLGEAIVEAMRDPL